MSNAEDTDLTWNVESHVLPAAELHGLGVPNPTQRTVRWCIPQRPAFVLGSTQPEADVDAGASEKLGIEVVRRRSGGGAVLVDRDDIIWIDVVLPSGDPLWQIDVGKAFLWLGEVWANVVRSLTSLQAEVHSGALVTTPWSRKVCFAGLGPGELTVAGRKVVGISQRRVREGALFQCSAYKKFDAERMASLLSVSEAERKELVAALESSTIALPDLEDAEVHAAFMRELERTHASA